MSYFAHTPSLSNVPDLVASHYFWKTLRWGSKTHSHFVDCPLRQSSKNHVYPSRSPSGDSSFCLSKWSLLLESFVFRHTQTTIILLPPWQWLRATSLHSICRSNFHHGIIILPIKLATWWSIPRIVSGLVHPSKKSGLIAPTYLIEITRVVGPTYDSWVVRHQVAHWVFFNRSFQSKNCLSGGDVWLRSAPRAQRHELSALLWSHQPRRGRNFSGNDVDLVDVIFVQTKHYPLVNSHMTMEQHHFFLMGESTN